MLKIGPARSPQPFVDRFWAELVPPCIDRGDKATWVDPGAGAIGGRVLSVLSHLCTALDASLAFIHRNCTGLRESDSTADGYRQAGGLGAARLGDGRGRARGPHKPRLPGRLRAPRPAPLT
jgi:hypothetical protein